MTADPTAPVPSRPFPGVALGLGVLGIGRTLSLPASLPPAEAALEVQP